MSLSGRCSSLSSCLNTAELVQGRESRSALPSRQEAAQSSARAGRPISGRRCCYVGPRSAFVEAGLSCSRAEQVPASSAALRERGGSAPPGTDGGLDSRRLLLSCATPAWFSGGTKGFPEKVCNGVLSTALFFNFPFFVAIYQLQYLVHMGF